MMIIGPVIKIPATMRISLRGMAAAVLDVSTMPCRCPGTLARHLDNFQAGLTSFLEIEAFDQDFQSP